MLDCPARLFLFSRADEATSSSAVTVLSGSRTFGAANCTFSNVTTTVCGTNVPPTGSGASTWFAAPTAVVYDGSDFLYVLDNHFKTTATKQQRWVILRVSVANGEAALPSRAAFLFLYLFRLVSAATFASSRYL